MSKKRAAPNVAPWDVEPIGYRLDYEGDKITAFLVRDGAEGNGYDAAPIAEGRSERRVQARAAKEVVRAHREWKERTGKTSKFVRVFGVPRVAPKGRSGGSDVSD